MAHPITVTGKRKIRLRDYNPAHMGGFKSEEHARKSLERDLKEIGRLQDMLFAERRWGILVVIQGPDTAGKSTLIKHLMSGVNPSGCHVANFKAPSAEEFNQDYLRRHIPHLPKRGHIALFDRSYYEEVVVVRVHPELLEKQRIPNALRGKGVWKRRYRQIRDFERYLGEDGFVVVKFFLNLSKAEQGKRLEARLKRGHKNWKYSHSDIEERKCWRHYHGVNEDMVNSTATPQRPWHVLPANNKWVTRALAARALVKVMRKLRLHYPTMGQREHAKSMRELRATLRAERKRGKQKRKR